MKWQNKTKRKEPICKKKQNLSKRKARKAKKGVAKHSWPI